MNWISVKDRLPKNGEWVLVRWLNGGGYSFNDAFYDPCGDEARWYTGNNLLVGVTHWMPIPKVAE